MDGLSRDLIGYTKRFEQVRLFELARRFLEPLDDLPSPRLGQSIDQLPNRLHLDLRDRHELTATCAATFPARNGSAIRFRVLDGNADKGIRQRPKHG